MKWTIKILKKLSLLRPPLNGQAGFTLTELIMVAGIATIAGYIGTKGILRFNQTMTARSAKSDSNQQMKRFIRSVEQQFSTHVSKLYPGEPAGKFIFNTLRNVPMAGGTRMALPNNSVTSSDPALSADKSNIHRNRKFVLEREYRDNPSDSYPIERIEYEVVCSTPLTGNVQKLLQSKSWQNAINNQIANGCVPANYCDWTKQTLVIRKDVWYGWNNGNDNNANVYPSPPNNSKCFPETYEVIGSSSPHTCSLKATAQDLKNKALGMSFCAWNPDNSTALNFYFRLWSYQLGTGSDVLYETRDAALTRASGLNDMEFIKGE